MCEFHMQDLIQDLKSELASNLEHVTLAMMMTPAEFDASQLRDAIAVSTTSVMSSLWLVWFLLVVWCHRSF